MLKALPLQPGPGTNKVIINPGKTLPTSGRKISEFLRCINHWALSLKGANKTVDLGAPSAKVGAIFSRRIGHQL
jgi:hypothetical protein